MPFLHGLKEWNKSLKLSVHPGVICCSLHITGKTSPLRPFGFVLDVPDEAVVASYAKDVCSHVVKGVRHIGRSHSKAENFGLDWDRLIQQTPPNKHNEIWVQGYLVDVIGFYQNGSGNGYKKFEIACREAKLIRFEI